MATRSKYTSEFKDEAVKLAQAHPDKPIKQLALELGVPQTVLNNWVRRAGVRQEKSEPPKKEEKKPADVRAEVRVRELERQLARVTQERDVLKKAVAYSTGRRNSF